ncbi:MAG: hypothetical protein OER86_03670 [Phycisphaerae bacterium]|nr:hypothetical protein [Phycisphaerae bacterium]
MVDPDASALTWVALLGQWVDFARSALALPDDADGRAWRSAVPDIIGLQAVTLALGQVGQLPADERALGLDRARLLIEQHSRRLAAAFDEKPLHPRLEELIADASRTLAGAEKRHASSLG